MRLRMGVLFTKNSIVRCAGSQSSQGSVMEYHFGRLIDHVHIVVADLEKSRAFYKAILAALGKTMTNDDTHDFGSDELFVSQANEKGKVSHIHLAFQTPDRKMVDKFYRAALEAGGKDNGAPGERPYHPGYYGAFILDPDGNNIEAVHHGAATRSAASVIMAPAKS
jgi:catechol 2,3-dioxygenase-like lactoylglutathione lyase family enzyme